MESFKTEPKGRYRRLYPDRNIWGRVLATLDKLQPAKLDPEITRNLSPDKHRVVVEPLATQGQDLTGMPTGPRGDIALSKRFLRRSGSW